jgi:hypothetical protein
MDPCTIHAQSALSAGSGPSCMLNVAADFAGIAARKKTSPPVVASEGASQGARRGRTFRGADPMLIHAFRLDPLPRRVFHLDQVWRPILARSDGKDGASIRTRAEACAGAGLTAEARRHSISWLEHFTNTHNRVPYRHLRAIRSGLSLTRSPHRHGPRGPLGSGYQEPWPS